MSGVAICRSCDAEVVFVPSAKTGAPTILNAEPEKRVVVLNTLQGQVVGPPVRAEDAPRSGVAVVVDVYTDHHVTCPDAAAWKGKTR